MPGLNLFGHKGNQLRPIWQSNITDYVMSVAWSPDNNLVAAAEVSGPITIFHAANGRPVHRLTGHGFGTTAIAWQPRGSLLASVGQDGKVRIWESRTGEVTHTLDAGATWSEKLAWHPSGNWLATAAGRKARVWSAAGELIRELPAQAGTIMDLAWRPATEHLTLLAYGAATTFAPLQGVEPVKILAWKGSPLALAWSPDGSILAHGNQDQTVHFWYYNEARDLQMWGYPTKVRELAWDFTSRYLATGGGPKVCVWDCQAGQSGPEGTRPQLLEGHDQPLTAVRYQSNGFLLASAGLDGRIILWHPTSRRSVKIGEFRFPSGEASALAWSTDDRYLAIGNGEGIITVLRAG
jgi:WD40 repeat protein